jgi:hypothetical protein
MLQIECPVVEALVTIDPHLSQFVEHSSHSADRASISAAICGTDPGISK